MPRNPAFEEDPLRQITLRYQHVIRGVPESVYRKADRDLGLFYTTKREADKGRFRTPSLRELKYTAPYMHNGAFFELEEVIDFYDEGGARTRTRARSSGNWGYRMRRRRTCWPSWNRSRAMSLCS